MNREQTVALMKTITTVSETARYFVDDVHLADDTIVVASVSIRGHAHEGGDFETPIILYFVLGDNGIIRMESFTTVDEAIAAAEPRFVRTMRALEDAINGGGVDAIGRCLDPGLVVHDHITHRDFNYDTYLDNSSRMARMPGVVASCLPVLVLGDRHGVARCRYTAPRGSARGPWADVGGSESDLLMSIRVTSTGALVRVEHFKADDLVAASIRAEELYAEDEATGESLAGSRRRMFAWRAFENYNRDWDVVSTCLDPNVATIDHRSTGFGRMHTAAELLAMFQSVAGVSEAARARVDIVHLATDTAMVFSSAIAGRNREGGEFENLMVLHFILGDHGITTFEIFPPNELDAALAAAQSIV
jgi:hypothetical protein